VRSWRFRGSRIDILELLRINIILNVAEGCDEGNGQSLWARCSGMGWLSMCLIGTIKGCNPEWHECNALAAVVWDPSYAGVVEVDDLLVSFHGCSAWLVQGKREWFGTGVFNTPRT
jgi:hypothetical protein